MRLGSEAAGPGAVRHPVFARYYARVSVGADARLGFAEVRRRLLAGLSGRVIEVGAGNGLNFARYPASVAQVVAVEPEPLLGRLARESARRRSRDAADPARP